QADRGDVGTGLEGYVDTRLLAVPLDILAQGVHQAPLDTTAAAPQAEDRLADFDVGIPGHVADLHQCRIGVGHAVPGQRVAGGRSGRRTAGGSPSWGRCSGVSPAVRNLAMRLPSSTAASAP